VARKVPIRKGTLTCRCYKPIRARDRQSSPPRPFKIETDPDQARATLARAGLSDLVTEVAIFDGQLGIRFARSATLKNMESVVEALRTGWDPEPSRQTTDGEGAGFGRISDPIR